VLVDVLCCKGEAMETDFLTDFAVAGVFTLFGEVSFLFDRGIGFGENREDLTFSIMDLMSEFVNDSFSASASASASAASAFAFSISSSSSA
jgi:hypothetical protein